MVEKLKMLVEMGFSQQAIADGIGVGKATISRWLSGSRNPSGENIDKINNYLAWLREEMKKL